MILELLAVFMRNFILIISFVFILKAQGQTDPKPTIPLRRTIQIEITRIDSSTLNLYNLYYFEFGGKFASFLAKRNDKIFKKGIADVELCDVRELRCEKDGEGINLRGHAITNGLIISEGDSIKVHFHFNEYSESPTLRLCSTDN